MTEQGNTKQISTTEQDSTLDHATVTLAGTVEKIIRFPGTTDKAQIAIDEADDLYREMRIENVLHTDQGEIVALKPGAEVDVTIVAPEGAVIPKP
jgi:hypothetical protein